MFEIVMGIDDFRIQLVKYCTWGKNQEILVRRYQTCWSYQDFHSFNSSSYKGSDGISYFSMFGNQDFSFNKVLQFFPMRSDRPTEKNNRNIQFEFCRIVSVKDLCNCCFQNSCQDIRTQVECHISGNSLFYSCAKFHWCHTHESGKSLRSYTGSFFIPGC